MSVDGPGDARSRLREIIGRSVIRGKDMLLASGGTTSIYFNLKPAMLDPEGANLIGELVLDALDGLHADAIGGLAMGAIPLVTAVSLKSYPERRVPAFFVRSERKEHGTEEQIQGNFEPGSEVVLVDDVTTTAGSVLKAVRTIRQAGGRVSKVVTIVDREEGASENLAAEGIDLIAIFRKHEFKD